MIIALGIDIVEITRIGEVLGRRGERFRARVFTAGEIEYCEQRGSPLASYAARFAAKEAAMKALGTGWAGGIGWRDVEIVRLEGGKPAIKLAGRAEQRFAELGAVRVHVSLSHSGDLAIAQVVLEGPANKQ